ncbi:MAG: pseudouridine synthase [Crocinitomicaceae bacterium]|nr:pseudouridine synthase [Crocinitomicaceae bacterium]|tara:strand:- start:3719 stop:4915 length:1197 start_codon:yes stop_codon:yes gene_type:complete
MGIVIPIILVTFCSLVIWRSVDGFTVASDYLGRNLSDGVKGATINAIASSMPELFTTMFFLFFLDDIEGFSGGIGTTAGSAIFNAMIIPAIAILSVIYSGVTNHVEVSKKVVLRDGIALIVTEFILIVLISGHKLEWWHGMVLMLMYAVYITYMLTSMTKVESVDSHEYNAQMDGDSGVKSNRSLIEHGLRLDLESLIIGKKQIKGSNAWPLLITSTLTIAVSCYLLVLACEWIGSKSYHVPYFGYFDGLDIPILFVALIIASMASSIPDTIISMKDAKKGNYDDAVSNALGSNMFDICFALGFPLFLYTIINGPIEMTPEIIDMSGELRVLLWLLTVVVFLIFYLGKYMGKTKAFGLLGIYLLFGAYVVGLSLDHPIAIATSEALRDMLHTINGFFY